MLEVSIPNFASDFQHVQNGRIQLERLAGALPVRVTLAGSAQRPYALRRRRPAARHKRKHSAHIAIRPRQSHLVVSLAAADHGSAPRFSLYRARPYWLRPERKAAGISRAG